MRMPLFVGLVVVVILGGGPSTAAAVPSDAVPVAIPVAGIPATAMPIAGQDRAPAGEWPLLPRPDVVAGFDPPETRWGAGHRGVDLAGRVGQPVRAALAGRISFAGSLAGRGVVVVDHGATRTTYEPVASLVEVGERVPAGAVIGRLQLFGSHCFPRACLHWGLIEGREHYLDPLTLVGAGPVRLLPLAGRPAATPLLAPRDPPSPGRLVGPPVGPRGAAALRAPGQARGWA
jgi:murein DD-endopeptidase MepM/ murein hydrolase activator NlpD